MLLPGGFTKAKAAYLLEVLKELETVERLKCFKSNQQKVVPAYRWSDGTTGERDFAAVWMCGLTTTPLSFLFLLERKFNPDR